MMNDKWLIVLYVVVVIGIIIFSIWEFAAVLGADIPGWAKYLILTK